MVNSYFISSSVDGRQVQPTRETFLTIDLIKTHTEVSKSKCNRVFLVMYIFTLISKLTVMFSPFSCKCTFFINIEGSVTANKIKGEGNWIDPDMSA